MTKLQLTDQELEDVAEALDRPEISERAKENLLAPAPQPRANPKGLARLAF